jgi:hypothetical protein
VNPEKAGLPSGKVGSVHISMEAVETESWHPANPIFWP